VLIAEEKKGKINLEPPVRPTGGGERKEGSKGGIKEARLRGRGKGAGAYRRGPGERSYF